MSTDEAKAKKITVSEIAAAAGVSPATVSRVMNQRSLVAHKTYTKVARAVKELGGEIRQESAPQSDRSNGLILINLPSLSNPFYGPVIQGARASIQRHGYTSFINEGHIDYRTIDPLLQIIRQNNVIGLITLNAVETPLCKRLANATCVVQCCEYNEEIGLPYVSIDDVAAAKNATEHLIRQGRRRIAFINGSLRFKYARQRLEGFTLAHEEAGIPISPEYIVNLPEIDSDLATSAAIQLLSLSTPPDAIFVVSDIYGAAALRACYLSGKKVPEQVAVVSFDNLEISKILIPSLSSVSQPMSQLGFLASETLFEKLANSDIPPKKILLDTELIVRESSSL